MTNKNLARFPSGTQLIQETPYVPRALFSLAASGNVGRRRRLLAMRERPAPLFLKFSTCWSQLVPGREGGGNPRAIRTKIAKLVWPSRPESSRNHTVVKLKVICWRRLEGWGRVFRVGVVALTPRNKTNFWRRLEGGKGFPGGRCRPHPQNQVS